MKLHLSERMLVRRLAIIVAGILVIMPFHAMLTVWLASFIGHYVGVRLWKEWLLVLLTACSLVLLIRHKPLLKQLSDSILVRLIFVYLAVQFIWGIVAYVLHHVVWQALAYGWISDARYFIFFLAVWIIAIKTPWLQTHWRKLVFWPAVIVIVIGLLQYFVLPYDVMTHFGYNSATIFPYEDINHNVQYLRIMSSLRGANPLGAYLLVVLSLLGAVVLRQRKQSPAKNRRLLIGTAAFGVSGLLVLVLTFSRSAWIGLVLAIAVMAWAVLKNGRARAIVLAVAGACGIITGGVMYGLRNDTTFQNIFFHTQVNSSVATTSNEGHLSGLQRGLKDIIDQPFGLGPGTAGPASVYNAGHPTRIAENYFIQIAQESGLIGVGLFIAIQSVLAWQLWQRRRDAIALGLLGALAGVSFVGLLSHVWADDTLAYIWWGLAAIAISWPLGAGTSGQETRRSGR